MDVTENKTARNAMLRSKISNGTKLATDVDGRTADARRFRDLVMSYVDDLGGADKLTEAQRALIASGATLQLQGERLQAAVLRGERVNLEQLTRTCNSLMRVLTKLGLKRGRSEAAGPSLAQYILEHHSEEASAG